MRPDQLPDLSMTHMILSDPMLLFLTSLPLVIIIGVIYYRMRTWRRLTAMSARNEQRYDETREQNAAQWQEAAVRTERMIVLLTEIRDHVARIAPPDASARTSGSDPGSSK